MKNEHAQAIETARALVGVPPIPTLHELVERFRFREEWYGSARGRTSDQMLGTHYQKPSRGSLLSEIMNEITMAGGEDGNFPGKKRPKILAGAVLKRVYPTYPEEGPFRAKWKKIDDAEELAWFQQKFGRKPRVLVGYRKKLHRLWPRVLA